MMELILGLVIIGAFASGAATTKLLARKPVAPVIELTTPEGRVLSDEEKVARAIRAKHAMDEFLAPALKAIEAEYLTALSSLAANEPWETGKITKLAVAQRVINTVGQQIIQAVLEGELSGQELNRAKKIAALPEAKRRWAM